MPLVASLNCSVLFPLSNSRYTLTVTGPFPPLSGGDDGDGGDGGSDDGDETGGWGSADGVNRTETGGWLLPPCETGPGIPEGGRVMG